MNHSHNSEFDHNKGIIKFYKKVATASPSLTNGEWQSLSRAIHSETTIKNFEKFYTFVCKNACF